MRNRNGTANGNHGRRRNQESKASFYPKLIVYQIVALQCWFYFCLVVCFQINHVLYNTSLTIDRVFTDTYLRLWQVDALSVLLANLCGSVMLTIIVEKSKKCLDFSLTQLLLHFILTCLYGGFPTQLQWWIVHIAGTIAMVVFGEYLCSRKEMEDIPLLQI